MPSARTCPACGYETSGVPGHICPECGEDERDHRALTSASEDLFQQVVARVATSVAALISTVAFLLYATAGLTHGLHSHEKPQLVWVTGTAAWSLISLFLVARRMPAIGRMSGPQFLILLAAQALPVLVTIGAFMAATSVTY